MASRSMETGRMGSMAAGSVRSRNNVNTFGDPRGRPIMFAHGLASTQRMWSDVAPEFPDHAVVLFDLIGSGESDPDAYDPIRYDSLHGHADDVLVIIDELGLADIVYVGHSVAGIIGALAAIREPEPFSALVLVDASPRYLNDVGYGGGLDLCDIEQLVAVMDVDLATQTDHANDPRRLDASRHFARVALGCDHRRDLSGIVTPTLLLHCTADPMVPPAVARYMHAAIPGSTLVVMSGSSATLGTTIELGIHIRAHVR
ncbi:MAG TPA: alpha/beta hydrolase [Acidimicrobiia bacterium]|nr:alpha/beta hydrolase [Acidimicrobiia bacterium]